RDVMSVLRPRLEAALDCPRIDHVRTQTVAMFDRPELGDDGAIRSGRIVEGWTASGCGHSATLYVDFQPRGTAGTDFEIREQMPKPDPASRDAIPGEADNPPTPANSDAPETGAAAAEQARTRLHRAEPGESN